MWHISNFPHILTDSNLLDATLGNYYKWKGHRSQFTKKRSNTEKYIIFLIYLCVRGALSCQFGDRG